MAHVSFRNRFEELSLASPDGPKKSFHIISLLQPLLFAVLWGGLVSSQSFAQCLRCPDNANDVAIGATGPSTLTVRNGVNVNVSGQTVGACETLLIQAVVAYNPFGISGGLAQVLQVDTAKLFFRTAP
jgi:hypothetical protein